MGQFSRIGAAAFLLGVCSKPIRRWDTAGKITCPRTIGGHRWISLVEIERLLNHRSASPFPPEPSQIAICCRVSSHDQKKNGDLARQITTAQEFCRKKQLKPSYIFHDISNGLNTRRTGLKKLCRFIEQKQVTKVIITYPDRLTRFGFDYLKQYFQSHGTEITVMHQQPTRSMQEELVQDLIAIITSFSGRVYGMQSHQKAQQRQSLK
ncbi:MAG: IS607 family transposase [Promethearchaeota archaeon]